MADEQPIEVNQLTLEATPEPPPPPPAQGPGPHSHRSPQKLPRKLLQEIRSLRKLSTSSLTPSGAGQLFHVHNPLILHPHTHTPLQKSMVDKVINLIKTSSFCDSLWRVVVAIARVMVSF